jgi:hypothetical protein
LACLIVRTEYFPYLHSVAEVVLSALGAMEMGEWTEKGIEFIGLLAAEEGFASSIVSASKTTSTEQKGLDILFQCCVKGT